MGDKVHESPFDGRLMIRSMELENFKSYAGKVTLGPFHKCFSSIVGPNGSSKSNSIDAMLFVFGKRASKLRLKKVSELIHNSTQHPDLEFASVTVKFCNIIDRDPVDEDDDEAYDVVPGSELEVKRIAYRSNESFYYVDGVKKKFKEVGELLMKRGIDLQNNRFLILQGEVEQISMMKPKGQNEHEDGLLEYLEDIIGSNRHVESITEISKEVEELSDVRSEKLNRVKVVEKDMESLEEAKNEAQEYLKKDTLLTQKRAWLVQSQQTKAEEKLAELESKRETLDARLKEEEESQASCGSRRSELTKAFKDASKAFAELEADVAKSKKEFAAFERKDVKFREDIKDAEGAIKKLTAAESKQAKLVSKHRASVEKCAAKIEELEAEQVGSKEQLAAEEAKLEEILASQSGKASKLREELEVKQAGLGPLSEEASKSKSELDMVRTKVELLNKSSKEAQGALKDAQARMEELEIAKVSRPQVLKTAKKDLAKAESDFSKVQSDLADARAREQELDTSLRESRAKVANAKAALSQSAGRGATLSALMEAAANRKSPIASAGLYGRLGDLASIDAKYDTAVSTACAAGLDYLVTDATKGAEACVKYLREKHLGRATFAIVEKLQHLRDRMNRQVETPEGVPRLFDLINISDPDLRVAFYHIMRDTLVAESLEQAVRIAYRGNKAVWRVVTLDGQVIDTSGTMSGGGNRVKKGGMKIESAKAPTAKQAGKQSKEDQEVGLVSKAQLAEMEGSTSELQQALEECRKEVKRLAKEKTRLERLVADLGMVVAKTEAEIGQMDEQMELLATNIEELESKCTLSKKDEAELKQVQKQESKLEETYTKAKAKLDALEQATADLHAKIADIGGPKAARARATMKEIEEKLAANRKAATKAQTELKKAQSNAEKAQSAQDEAAKEKEQTQASLEELRSKFKQLEEDALLVMQCLEEAKRKEESEKKRLKEIEAEVQEEEARFNKADKALMDMRNQLKEYIDESSRKAKSAKTLESQLAELEEKYASLLKQSLPLKKAATAAPVEKASTDERSETQQADKETATDDAPAPIMDEMENEEEEEEEEEAQEASLRLDAEQLQALDFDLLCVEIDQLETDVQKLKKVVNMSAIKDYLEREAEYMSRVAQLDEATGHRDKKREALELLRKQRLDEFMAGFSQITLRLKEMYQMITLGGDAELELVDTCDPFSEGIVFSVRPPKKSWKNISNLSGGEKTLSSLALVFALHHYNPTPLYVMDEIDAALDFKNVSIVGNYIKERTKNAQFIIISLRNNMFELADRLSGIYKTNDATKTITINPAKVAKAAKQRAAARTNEARAPLSTLNV